MKKYKKAYIEITNQCNLSCSFCPKTTREPKMMTTEEFSIAVSSLKDVANQFYLHIMGEPLSHSNFNEILNVAKAQDISVNIITNGTLIKKQENAIINSNIRMICFSLHSFADNLQDTSFKKYIDDIVEFALDAAKKGIIVELRMWTINPSTLNNETNLNYEILQYLQLKLMLDFNLINSIKELLDDKSTNKRKNNLKLKDNIYIGMSTKFNWPDINLYSGNSCDGFCYGLRNQIGVLADGTVVPCCLDSNGYINLGNIFEQSIQEIVTTKKATDLYNGFTNRKAVNPLCTTCGYMKQYYKYK